MRRYSRRQLVLLAAMAGVLAGRDLPAQTKGDPALGEAIAARVCIACHAPDGASPVPNTPRLAGLHATYLTKQLKDYRDGKRTSAMMMPYLEGLTDEDFLHVSAYFAELEPTLGVVTDPSLLALGRSVYVDGNAGRGLPACAGCHGDDGEGTRRFPRLAGQSADYVIEQMRLYAAGERTNDRGLMQTVADRITGEETLAVAQYIASLVEPDPEEPDPEEESKP